MGKDDCWLCVDNKCFFFCNFHKTIAAVGFWMWGVMRATGMCSGVPSADEGLCHVLRAGLGLWSQPGELCRHTEHHLASPRCVFLARGMNHGVLCREHHKPTPALFTVPILWDFSQQLWGLFCWWLLFLAFTVCLPCSNTSCSFPSAKHTNVCCGFSRWAAPLKTPRQPDGPAVAPWGAMGINSSYPLPWAGECVEGIFEPVST